MFAKMGLSILVFYALNVIWAQNLQTLCREFCPNGSPIIDKECFNGSFETGKCSDGHPADRKCSNSENPIKMLSAERINISGILKCSLYNKGPTNATVILFNRCDVDVYREIARTTVQVLPNGSYFYELESRFKITNSNLYLLIQHDCFTMDNEQKDTLIDIRVKMLCLEECKKTCENLRSYKFCDCNGESKKIGMDCDGICESNEGECSPTCQEHTYCSKRIDLDLRYY